MKAFIILAATVALIHSVPFPSTVDPAFDALWQQYKDVFDRQYDPVTDLLRRFIWERNIRKIQKHNVQYDLGQHTYNLGINAYADKTNEERRNYHRSRTFRLGFDVTCHFIPPQSAGPSLPDAVDWRKKGYVTPVKNQGTIGAAWAFSATGSLEGQHFGKTGRLISLSEGQLVDCAKTSDATMKYAATYGMESEAEYPSETGVCRYNQSKVVARFKGYCDIQSGNETQLEEAVATMGPVSVAIDASHISFQLYKSGIYDEPACSPTNLDHAVLVVGYGSMSGKKYWIVKNSWGTSWGMQGYILMARNANNQCGIATAARFPVA